MNIWRIAVRPSYVWDARFLKVMIFTGNEELLSSSDRIKNLVSKSTNFSPSSNRSWWQKAKKVTPS